MATKLKIYKWDLARAAAGVQLPLLQETAAELSTDHDKARNEAQSTAKALVGGKIRGCSALVGGGFSVIVDLG